MQQIGSASHPHCLHFTDDISVRATNLWKSTSMHYTSQRHILAYGDLEEEPSTKLKKRSPGSIHFSGIHSKN